MLLLLFALEETMADYADRQTLAVQNELTELQMTYDTRLLATAMLVRSCQMLNTLLSAGMWTREDVEVVIEEATKDLYKLRTDVRVMTKDDPTDPTLPAPKVN